MKTRLLFAASIAALPAILAAQQAPQQSPQEPPPVTFRLEVNYVEVDASVTDAQGRVVTDLTANDFEVREDGKPQKISTFSLVNLPIERPVRTLLAGTPIEPDVRTNTESEGRIYMLLLDDFHTTFSNTPRVRMFLRDFIEQNFGTNDLAAVLFTSGAAGSQDFTNNRKLLLEAIDKFAGRNLRSEALEINDALNNRLPDDFRSAQTGSGSRNPSDQSGLPTDPLEAERAYQARSTLGTVKRAAEFMEGIRGRRKAMLLVSEGISYNIFDPFTNTSSGIIQQDSNDAIAAATRGNVQIYAIDPRGLSAFEESIEAGGTPTDITPSQFSVIGSLESSLRLSQQSLQLLADETGGFAAINRNDFKGAFERVVRENSTYYVLGYYPTNDRRDGRFRKLEVRVKRPGLQVSSRRGYAAPRGRAPEQARFTTTTGATTPLDKVTDSALNSPVPVVGIPLSLFAAPYKGEGNNAAVTLVLEMRGDGLRFLERNGIFSNKVDVAFSSIDGDGKIRGGNRHGISMDMKPDTVQRVKQVGFRVVSEMSLPPGRYQVRAAAADDLDKHTGAVMYDFDVPDFSKPGLTMSGVSLTSAAAAATPTAKPKDPLAMVLPGPPTTVRAFNRDDVIAFFTEFYENAPKAPTHMVDISVSVKALDGRVVVEAKDQRSSTELTAGRGGFGYGLQIPLKQFEPGSYVLRLEGKSRADGNAPAAGRDVLFTVK